MNLNAWQRFWLLASGVWGVIVLFQLSFSWSQHSNPSFVADFAWPFVAFWLGPVALYYAIGAGLLWVIGGVKGGDVIISAIRGRRD